MKILSISDLPARIQPACRALAAGMKASEIAEVHKLKVATVRLYLRQAMAALGVSKRDELRRWLITPAATRGAISIKDCAGITHEVWPRDMWASLLAVGRLPDGAQSAIFGILKASATVETIDELLRWADEMRRMRVEASTTPLLEASK